MSAWSDFWAWLKPPAIKPPIIMPTPENEAPAVGSMPLCGIALLKQLENCKLKAYPDEKGIPTIGYGHTEGVRLSDTCTQAQADRWLAYDCAWAWQTIRSRVSVPLTSNQGGALLSFVYNLGAPQFEKSTLLTILNSGNYAGVPGAMKQWIWETKNGMRTISQGLVNRRNAEAALWIGADWRQT
jgi:lysozyme